MASLSSFTYAAWVLTRPTAFPMWPHGNHRSMTEKCPRCTAAGRPVSVDLVRHHVLEPWRRQLVDKSYNFCGAPDCDVVYFAPDGYTIDTPDLRRVPAYKTGRPGDLLCFCFDVSGAAALDSPDPVPYVRERVRREECSCNILNPSGACCLGSIGRWRKAKRQA